MITEAVNLETTDGWSATVGRASYQPSTHPTHRGPEGCYSVYRRGGCEGQTGTPSAALTDDHAFQVGQETH